MVADSKIIGHRIRQRREHLNISQEKLGEMIGVTYQQIQKYEKGTNRVSAERLSGIARNLKVPINFFFEGAKEFLVAEKQEGKNYSVQKEKSLSPQERELLNYFRSLQDTEARANLLGFLKSVCKKKKT
ncbi:MAG: XRE family transcriptional regulator [Nitrospiraceae bacterium]|nr:MAG: XRE family transcriptional regulator [Nitrospiraceae bacterium]